MCNSKGQKAGKVVSNLLEGTLGYVNAAEHRVGVDFKAEGGADLMDFSYEGAIEEVAGSVIGEITPVNKFEHVYTLAFTRDSEGFQSIRRFEGGPEEVPTLRVGGAGPFNGSIAGSFKYTGELLELKSVI